MEDRIDKVRYLLRTTDALERNAGGLDVSLLTHEIAYIQSNAIESIGIAIAFVAGPFPTSLPPINISFHQNAITFLISAIAFPGFNPFGHVLEQFKIVWHRYKLIELSSAAFLSSLCWSRESASHRYDCSSTAGPKYSSWFHQYDGHDVEQQAQRMHS